MNFLVKQYRNFVRQNRQSKLIKIGYKIANNFVIAYHNESFFDMDNNGELFIIKSINKVYRENEIIIFDVGAHHGDYSTMVNQHIQDKIIHCFEIVPETFNKLKKNLFSNKNIILNNFGLSNKEEKIQVTWFPKEDSGSSINSLPWDLYSDKVDCEVISGDYYCLNNNIKKIDFLKIDTEGHELSVLNGFNHLLSEGKISVIQFEYGLTYIPSRNTLGDIYNILEPYDYLIGRLFPEGVEFKTYDLFKDETFKPGNYIAVHKTATPLIKKIQI